MRGSVGLKAQKRLFKMAQKRHRVDQIISKLRRAEVELGKGKKVPKVCKLIGIVEQTYYRWRQKYGGMQPKNLSHGFVFVWPELTTYLLDPFAPSPGGNRVKIANRKRDVF